MHRSLSLVALVVGGCALATTHDPPPAHDSNDLATGTVVEPKSGSRLRALAWRLGAGVVAAEAFRDTKLDALCRFAPTEDGLRCVPTGGDTPSAYVTGFELYFDAACTMPGISALRHTGTEEHPRFARLHRASTTGCGSSVSAVVLAPPTGQRNAWTKQGNDCVPFAIPPYLDDVRAFTPLPNTELVGGSVVQVPISPELAAESVRGDDGSLAPWGLFDLRHGTACIPDATGRCFPTIGALTQPMYFSDDHCTDRAALFSPSWSSSHTDCHPRVAYEYDACRNTRSFFDVGPAAERLFVKVGATCVAGGEGWSVHRLGPPIDASAFPATQRAEESGVLRTRAPSGALVSSSFLDRSGAQTCAPRRTVDGKVRCVPPIDGPLTGEFADPACTQPVIIGAPPEAGCVGSRPHLALDETGQELYTVGATLRETRVYQRDRGACRLIRTATVYDVTPAPPASFDELTLSEESCHPTAGTCSETCSSDATCNGGFCSASVCLAKIPNGQPIPPELGGCTAAVGARACMSGACGNDLRCGVPHGGRCTSTDACREGRCLEGVCDTSPPPASSSGAVGAPDDDDVTDDDDDDDLMDVDDDVDAGSRSDSKTSLDAPVAAKRGFGCHTTPGEHSSPQPLLLVFVAGLLRSIRSRSAAIRSSHCRS